jgi:hypothetical protein
MDRAWRWIIAIVAVIAIVALLAFARGTPEHGGPQHALTNSVVATVGARAG